MRAVIVKGVYMSVGKVELMTLIKPAAVPAFRVVAIPIACTTSPEPPEHEKSPRKFENCDSAACKKSAL